MPDEKKEKKGSTVSLHHRVKVIGKDGKIKYDSGEKKSDSFVKNFIATLANLLTDSHYASNIWTDHDGVPRSGVSKTNWSSLGYPYTITATTVDTYGIRVGSGTTAVTATDVTLDTLIDHGVGAGELSYGAQVWVDVVEAGGNVDWALSRTYSNSSGGTVTIREIGLSIKAGYYIQIARDVLSSAVPVADGEVAVVEYIWRTAVTA